MSKASHAASGTPAGVRICSGVVVSGSWRAGRDTFVDVATLAHEATMIHEENVQTNLRSRSTLIGHMNAIQTTAESAQEYIQRTEQQLETYEEEDMWTTEFTPVIDQLFANLSPGNFQIADDQTGYLELYKPLPRGKMTCTVNKCNLIRILHRELRFF